MPEKDRNKASIDAFIVISEVDTAINIADHIFQRKYHAVAPDIPRHFVAFYRTENHDLIPASYLHAWKYRGCYMVGGACTDGTAVRRFLPQHQAAIARSPGIFFFTLRYAFAKLQDECRAFFGYCGDARALEVDLQAGFRPTDIDKLLIYTPKPLLRWTERRLIRAVAALGPF